MLFPVRLTPTSRIASLAVAPGWTEILAPKGTTPPLSLPFGPVPPPGEPECKPSHSRMTCAEAQFVKFVVSANVGTWLNRGSLVELFVPGPNHATGIRLLLNVIALASGVALVTLRV